MFGRVSTLVLAATAAGAVPYPIVPRSMALLTGTFTMQGRITAAKGVRGEHRGETISRTWVFQARDCGRTSCRQLVLNRERAPGLQSAITLRRGADWTYRGAGTFDAPLRCLGRTYPLGETAPYTISVRITQAVLVDGVPFAWTITARYVSGQRIDHTICPLGPSHDAARYTGTLVPTPGYGVKR